MTIKNLDILKYKRPAGSVYEDKMIAKFIDCIDGMKHDKFGNRYIEIGNTDKMFSCHTDTVHSKTGIQKIKYDAIKKHIFVSDSDCLGADDGAGIIIMLEMIKKGIDGLYVFHREEEVGGNGSKYFSENSIELLENKNYCIAFDRKGFDNIITHQGFSKTCSNEFAELLADKSGFMFPDDTGSFTDSANYTNIISECTNLSVGYYNAHTKNEYLNLDYFNQLLDFYTDSKTWNNLTYHRELTDDGDYSFSYNTVDDARLLYQCDSEKALSLLAELADDADIDLYDYMDSTYSDLYGGNQ